jgi:AbrB family looped-hinge helix DNA binding protein
MTATVTDEGTVVIPQMVRDRLGLQPGDAVDFQIAVDGRVVLVKISDGHPASRFEALRGHAGAGLSTDEIMALTRGD